MPQLDPSSFVSQLFWLAVFFTALYVALARFILPPLVNVIVRREEAVASDVEAAQRFKLQAQEAKAVYEQALAEARSRAQQLMLDAGGFIKANHERSTLEMERSLARQLGEAEQRIQIKKQDLLNGMAPSTGDIASLIVEKLIMQKPGNERVSAVVSELSRQRGTNG